MTTLAPVRSFAESRLDCHVLELEPKWNILELHTLIYALGSVRLQNSEEGRRIQALR